MGRPWEEYMLESETTGNKGIFEILWCGWKWKSEMKMKAVTLALWNKKLHIHGNMVIMYFFFSLFLLWCGINASLSCIDWLIQLVTKWILIGPFDFIFFITCHHCIVTCFFRFCRIAVSVSCIPIHTLWEGFWQQGFLGLELRLWWKPVPWHCSEIWRRY